MKTQLLTSLKLLALCVFAFSQSHSQTVTFNYTGGMQTYTVPVGVTLLTIDAYGAQGGFGYNVPNVTPGLGGRVQASLAVTPGEVLNIYVGGQGGPGGTTVGGTAGYNGGGTGGGWSGGRSGGGGGGASDIRQGGNALANRVIVAAGGGGTGVNHSSGDAGGNGGGLTGSNGLTGTYLGAGATQVAGGAPNGVLGGGGNAPAGQTGGGGGGGYYGGGSSAWEGGGGGSSYTAPTIVTAITHTAGNRTGNGQITITPIIIFSATVAQSATIQCNGQSTAALTTTLNGGTAPFTYSWAPSGGNAATATGLAAGTYTVTITDANSLVTTQTFTVTQPPAFVSTPVSQTNIACNGNSTGSASVIASGGTGGYTYTWTPSGGNAATATGLAAGVYTVTVTDANACLTSQTFNITQPTALVASASSQTDILCNGGNNGSATVSASGGTGGYTYAWLPSGGTSATASNLVAATYTVTVTDANSCSTTQTFNITQLAPVVATATSTAILCNGDSATINVVGSGGTGGPYPGAGVFVVAAGVYTYTINDANGCTATTSITVTEPPSLNTTSSFINPSTCNGINGSINLSVSGGTPGYTYLWSNSNTTQDLSSISAGTYACFITDANGCTASLSVTLVDPTPPTVSLAITTDTVCSSDGLFGLTGGVPMGGSFSGPGVSAGSFNPSAANIGLNTITYTYTDLQTGCSGTNTDIIFVDPCAGVAETVLANTFNVYPNPSNGTFTLQLNTNQQADVLIYDAVGKLVLATKVQPNMQQQISIESAGVYLITVVTTDGNRSSQRMVVNQ